MAKKDKRSAKKSFPKAIRKTDEPVMALERDLVVLRPLKSQKSLS